MCPYVHVPLCTSSLNKHSEGDTWLRACDAAARGPTVARLVEMVVRVRTRTQQGAHEWDSASGSCLGMGQIALKLDGQVDDGFVE